MITCRSRGFLWRLSVEEEIGLREEVAERKAAEERARKALVRKYAAQKAAAKRKARWTK